MIKGIAKQGVGMGLNMLDDALFGNKRRKNQVDQQKKLTEIQESSNKRLADYGMGIQKEMFDATGYVAQRKQMEEAGLNPALMYGHAGAGGSTGSANTGSVGMGQASSESQSRAMDIQNRQLALQEARAQAEIDNIKADTDVKRKDIGVKEADIDLKGKQVDDILEDIKSKEVQRAGYVLQNEFDKVRNYVNENTAEMGISYLSKQLDYMDTQIGLLNNNKEISDETMNEVINSYKLQNQNLIADILSKEQGIEMSKQQVLKMVQDIAQGWEGLRIQDKSVSVGEKANKIKEKYPSMNQVGGRVLNDVVNVSEKIDNWISKLFKGEFNSYYENK